MRSRGDAGRGGGAPDSLPTPTRVPLNDQGRLKGGLHCPQGRESHTLGRAGLAPGWVGRWGSQAFGIPTGIKVRGGLGAAGSLITSVEPLGSLLPWGNFPMCPLWPALHRQQ